MDLAAVHLASMQAAIRMLGDAAPGGWFADVGDGVLAAVAPARAERSLFNAVVYADGAALLAAVPRLEELYAAAGVRAWCVWVHPGDAATAAGLQDAGLRRDATPERMGCEIASVDLGGADPPGLRDGTVAELAALNDVAYGLPVGEMSGGIGEPEGLRIRVAEGPTGLLAGVGTLHVGSDCWFAFVATVPVARGNGLAKGLMRAALREAAAAGCTTSTLEATQAGRPVYASLGFTALGALEMWERRTA